MGRFAVAILGLVLSAVLLAGCPGSLEHKERFLMAAGNVGQAGNAAGGGGGLGGADSDAAIPEAGSDAGTESDAGPGLGPCGDVVTRIFVPSCGGTGCHGAIGPQQDLDLVSAGVAERVVGVSGLGCAIPLADPQDPEASLIYRKLSPTPPCGSPMPLARPALSDEDVACVLAWIAAQ
ncbi:MAG TPA: hypothetical protein VFK05_20185 [Polyangiaceae bacterium]|nr:hypothetical protein [Polyangiaceae bacterium]